MPWRQGGEKPRSSSNASSEVDGGAVLMKLLGKSSDHKTRSGYIKSFDAKKGYGFIACKDGSADVMVHGNHINGCSVGDYVTFTEGTFKGKTEARDLNYDDAHYGNNWEEDQASSPHHEYDDAARRRVLGRLQSEIERDRHASYYDTDYDRPGNNRTNFDEFHRGMIWNFDHKGNGYISCSDFPDGNLFVHVKHMKKFAKGDRVLFKMKWHKNAQEACDLKYDDMLDFEERDDEDHFLLPIPPPPPLERERSGSSTGDERLFDERHGDMQFGTIKSYNAEKGYGFISYEDGFSPSSSSCDVFVHSSQMKGFQIGDKVEFGLREWKQGKFQAHRLRKLEYLPDDILEGQDARTSGSSSSTSPTWIAAAETHCGFIKCFYEDEKKEGKGFGFIASKKTHEMYGMDVYVSEKEIKKGGFKKGDKVSFIIKVDRQKRPRASKLEAATQEQTFPVDETVFFGTIRSFNGDSTSGYGFIGCAEVMEKYSRDAFLHHKQIKTFKPGDVVKFKVRLNQLGHPQALDLEDAPQTISWLGLDTSKDTNEEETEEPTEIKRFGIIKSFDPSNGYGFITCSESSEDIFLHSSQREGFVVGDHVSFKTRLHKGKKQAHSLERHERPCNEKEAIAEDILEAALVEASAVTNEDAEEMKEGLKEVGGQAESWIEQPVDEIWSPEKGKELLARICELLKPTELETEQMLEKESDQTLSENRYFAALVRFREHIEKALEAGEVRQSNCSQQELFAEDDTEYIGIVKSFKTEKGYGFIQCDDLHAKYARDVFIPLSQYQDASVGCKVAFKVQVKRNQPQAMDVRVLSGPTKTCSFRGLKGDKLDELLLMACESSRVNSSEDIDSLLEASANPNCRDVTDQTPLMVCALQSRFSEKKCRILIGKGADLNGLSSTRPGRTQTVLEWARERINPKFANFLEAVSRDNAAEVEIAHEAPADDF